MFNQGEKLIIRPAKPEDKEFVWKAFQILDSSFFKYIIPITQELVNSWYDVIDYSKPIPLNAFVLQGEEDRITQFIGNATLGFNDNPRTQHVGGIGLGVVSAYQRRGIGTTLMKSLVRVGQSLGLRRLELTLMKENKPAIDLYEKLGFEKEGVLRKRHHVNGKDHDLIYLGLLLEKNGSEIK